LVAAALLLAAPGAPSSLGAAPAEKLAGRFVLVADEACRTSAPLTTIQDLGTSSLVVSPTQVRLVGPECRWKEAIDIASSLPLGRGDVGVLSVTPALIRVDLHPATFERSGPTEIQLAQPPYRIYRLVSDHLIAMESDFGTIAAVLPVQSGIVIVGWIHDRERGDPTGLPWGNSTKARFVSSDGVVSDVPGWPPVMAWDSRSTLKVLWALTIRPGAPGSFLMRLPLGGEPAFFAVPGTGKCEGHDRFTVRPAIEKVTNDTVEVRVGWVAGVACVKKASSGLYRFRAQGSRWERQGPIPLPRDRWPVPHPETVTARDSTFEVSDHDVLVTRQGKTERCPIDNAAPGAREDSFSFRLTAGGREVWLTTVVNQRCQIHRYEPGQ
jgi:hypothetical protein